MKNKKLIPRAIRNKHAKEMRKMLKNANQAVSAKIIANT